MYKKVPLEDLEIIEDWDDFSDMEVQYSLSDLIDTFEYDYLQRCPDCKQEYSNSLLSRCQNCGYERDRSLSIFLENFLLYVMNHWRHE